MKKAIVSLNRMLEQSFFDYLLLFTGSVIFLLFLKKFQGERFASLLILFTFTCFYILWGIFHQAKEKTLHLKNVLEYIFIGFTILILLTVILT